jgi:hypothetical protein
MENKIYFLLTIPNKKIKPIKKRKKLYIKQTKKKLKNKFHLKKKEKGNKKN